MLLFLVTVDPLRRAMFQLEGKATPQIILMVQHNMYRRRALHRRTGVYSWVRITPDICAKASG
jgi:hypothetical protein